MVSILPRIIDSLANQALEAFDLSSAIAHPGEGGRAREEVIRRFLAEILPPNFGIDTGFVVDAVGGISKQMDIVIYRKSRCPVLDVGGVKFFMVESVAAVLETKADIGSERVLVQALENIASVKGLDRTGDGKNVVSLGATGRPVRADKVQDQVFGAIVAGRSMGYETCLAKLAKWLRSNPDRQKWPNVYVDIKNFNIHYYITENGLPKYTIDPMSAIGLTGGSGIKRIWGESTPLAFLAADLLDFLQVVPEITFPTTSDLHSSGTGEAGYFYRTMGLVGKGRHLLFDPPIGQAPPETH